MTTTNFRKLLLLPCFFIAVHLLVSCNIFNPEPPDYAAKPWYRDGIITDIYSNTDAADLDINNFLYSGMLDMYFWSNRVPRKLVPTAANFPVPDSLLNRTMVQPEDRFSFIEKNGEAYLAQLQGGATATPLYGFSVAFFNSSNLRVARVVPPSPAFQAGLRRGMRIVSIDGKPVPATFDEYLNLVNNSSSITLEVEDSSQVRRRISIMRSFYTPQTVLATNVLTVGGKKVGYMMLNSFLGTVANDMNTAFSRFADERAQELVVDLRYNGGGFVNAAGQLCGLIAGQLAGNQYVRYTYNERYQGNNRSANITSYSNSLRLQRVFFLVNGGSASASELTINALRPFIDVVIIGTATAGKAVGSHLMFHQKSGYVLQPISFKYANARGEADFLNGFTPTRTLQDPVDRDFGVAQEAYLRAALQYIQTGSFPAISAKTQAEVQSFSEGTFISEVRNEITPVLAPVTTTLVRRK